MTLFMKQFLLLVSTAFLLVDGFSQTPVPEDTTWKNIYRETVTKEHNLIHTKLDVRFDFDNAWLLGKEWLTLAPHFYTTDSVVLDAKGMQINEVSIINGKTKKPLKYKYDGWLLNVKLDKNYSRNEKYTLYIDYISKPNELKVKGSAAITDAKGLYFINPKGEEKDKPTQVWTQGETEGSSVWFVTIDRPNQKTTQEIAMTVPSKFVTLSNGIKISEKKNADGTRTDFWKMDLPHAPYLFFMGVGDFAIIKDNAYKGKEISYYVDKDQAPYAKGVFGNTPEMMAFFSQKLGIDYPWPKYAQIVGRDYVSGAMENTTATLHQESAYQNNRELTDGNVWEETIAHELFHHWFGDLVTAESWSNLTVNESFANYSEYLWDEYKYGKDAADKHHFDDMQGYLMSGSDGNDLVRYHYRDKEDMFDAVSYNKGGRILHMLRNYVGDDAFFKSLNNYLTTNKYKTGEAAQLRLAFEETTGKDLNWFFNQWFYGSGHPKLKITYNYNITGIPNTTEMIVEQTQKTDKIFTLPVAVDVYLNGKPTRYTVWLKNKQDTFYFNTPTTPDLINFDADRILLAEKTDNKTEANYIALWKYGKQFLDRREAIDAFAKKKMPELAKGLHDKFSGIRQYTISRLATSPYKSDKVVLEEMERIAKTDADKKTRAAAINFLGKAMDKKYQSLFESAISDSSYSVSGEALDALASLDPANAYSLAKKYIDGAKGTLQNAIIDILIQQGSEVDFDYILDAYDKAPLSQEKLMLNAKLASFLAKVSDINKVKKGIDKMLKFRNAIPSAYRGYVDPSFKSSFDKISKAKGAEVETYVKENFKP